jgi:hypothetical protein
MLTFPRPYSARATPMASPIKTCPPSSISPEPDRKPPLLSEPIAKGLHITHWTSADLARQAVSDGIVETISPRTVWQILHDVDLQPHRTRY